MFCILHILLYDMLIYLMRLSVTWWYVLLICDILCNIMICSVTLCSARLYFPVIVLSLLVLYYVYLCSTKLFSANRSVLCCALCSAVLCLDMPFCVVHCALICFLLCFYVLCVVMYVLCVVFFMLFLLLCFSVLCLLCFCALLCFYMLCFLCFHVAVFAMFLRFAMCICAMRSALQEGISSGNGKSGKERFTQYLFR
jgi:hypothetical protein